MNKILVLILIALMQLSAGGALAQPTAQAAAEAELLSRIHGTRSARGMVVNDVSALQNIKLQPVKLANGQYMLRAVDATSGQFVKVSHPTMKAMVRDIGARRFTTPEAAQSSAGAHKGWLTRTATELERTYRGRLGGLQTQLNKVQGQAPPTTTPKPPTTTEPVVPKVAEAGNVAKPVVEGSSVASTTGSGAPKPSVTAAPSETGSGIKITDRRASANPSAPSSTNPASAAATATEAAAPKSFMGRTGSALKGALKGSVAAIPIMLATGLAVDLANQQRRDGYMSFERAAQNIMSPEFLGVMLGSLTGGTLGNVAGTMMQGLPFGGFLKAAATIGGAALGANLAGGGAGSVDWGRLIFTTAITAGVSLLVPGGIIGFAALAGTGFGADKLYDWLFKKKQPQPAQRARPATTAQGNGTNPPRPSGTGTAANPPPPPPPTTVVTAPPTPERGVPPPPPRTLVPPTPPDKSDLYGDLPYR